MNKQTQKSGDNSTNIQANKYIVHKGVPYSEVKEIALDVFKANFYELAGRASDVARERAEQITDEFLQKLKRENPQGFTESEDPDFQLALFTVQKEYARHGDKELGDLLVDLLVDRSKHDQRNIMQIVLNESLSVAPKLTEDQLAALTVIFVFRYTQNSQVGNDQSLGEYFDQHIGPFVKRLSKNSPCYQHLQYTGCGSIGIGSIALEKIIGGTYQGLFLKGFEQSEIKSRAIACGLDGRIFIPCINNTDKLQIKAINKDTLGKYLTTLSIPHDDTTKMALLFDVNKMSKVEVRQKCVSIRPYMSEVFDVWNASAMKNFSLTSVGISIGHANLKKIIGEFSDLSIWIN